MDSAFPLFQADDTLDEYYAMKPNLTSVQMELLQSFYRARRDTSGDGRVPIKTLLEHCDTIPLDNDLCVHILQKVDDEYAAIQLEKIKRSQTK